MQTELTSVIIPVYNEADYILTTVKKCCQLPIPIEIIVVDNNSTDDSYDLVQSFIENRGAECTIKLERAPQQGKANAMKAGFSIAQGDYIVFQDADLEYDPQYLVDIVRALGSHDVVHGCRICRPYDLGLFPYLANKLLLHMVNRRYKASLSDIFTGQRGYRRQVLNGTNLISTGFEIETELTVRALLDRLSLKEIDIPYHPRTKREGKKIGFTDFISIAFTYERTCLLVARERKRRLLAEAH